MRPTTFVCVILILAATACAGDDTADFGAKPAIQTESFRGTELKWTLAQAFAELNDEQGGYHPGEDWNFGQGRDDVGKPVHAIFQGEVVKVSQLQGGLGGLIIIRHTSPGGQTFTVPPKSASSYSYSEQKVSRVYSVYVHVTPEEGISGEPVERGEVIGKIADLVSVSPHLHFEVRLFGDSWSDDGSLVEPDDYWAKVGNSLSGYYTDAKEMVNSGLIAPSEFVEANRALGLTEPIGTGAPVASLPPAETIRPPQDPAPEAPSEAGSDAGLSRSNPIPLGVPFEDDDGNEVTLLRANRIFGDKIHFYVRTTCLRPSDVKCDFAPFFEMVGDSGRPGGATGVYPSMYGGISVVRFAEISVPREETGVVLAYKIAQFRSGAKTRFLGLGEAANPLPGSPDDPVPAGTDRVDGGWMEFAVLDIESTPGSCTSPPWCRAEIQYYDLCVTSRLRYVGDPSDEARLARARLFSPDQVKEWHNPPRPREGAGLFSIGEVWLSKGHFDVPEGTAIDGPDLFDAELCFSAGNATFPSWEGWLIELSSRHVQNSTGNKRGWELYFTLE